MSDIGHDSGFRITGRHVLIAMVLFFGAIFVVNGVFITYAVRSFPGLSTDEPFTRGLARNFNAELENHHVQAARGWTATVIEEPTLAQGGRFAVEMRDADGALLHDLAVTGVLERPAEAQSDQTLTFASVGGGRYAAEIAAPLGPGWWELTITTAFPDGAPFEARRRLWVGPRPWDE